MYRTPRGTNLSKLNTLSKNIFRTSELGLLWGIHNRNTLYITITRYTKDGLLFRLYKGLYSKKPVTSLHPFEIACAVAGPYSYISTESVLAMNGIIMQQPSMVTAIGLKNTKVDVVGHRIMVRSLSPSYLHNRNGIEDKGLYSIATVERAIADIEHYDKAYYLDNRAHIKERVLRDTSFNVYSK